MESLVALDVASDVYSRIRVDASADAVQVDPASLAVNPLDRQVLCKALAVCSGVKGVSVCGAPAERALRYAAAMGATSLCRINNCPSDAYEAAAHFADFLKAHPVPLVLCAQTGWDYATGDFPRWLSRLAGIGLVEDVCDFRLGETRPDTLEVVCQTDERRYALRVAAPVILSCTKAIFPQEQVRIPSMRDMMLALRARLDIWQPQAVYTPRKVFSCYRPMPSRPAVRFLPLDDYAAVADAIREAAEKGKNERSAACGTTSVFSGRILADVRTHDEPEPLYAAGEILWQENIPPHRDLKTAPVVFSGGMGLDDTAWHLLEQAARECDAAVACTRPVYQAGRRPYYEHVGQTGVKVAPQLYLAFGISGALQHIAGMIRSARVLAVNTDPDAEIFKYADYGIVGDACEVLRGLSDELKRRGGIDG